MPPEGTGVKLEGGVDWKPRPANTLYVFPGATSPSFSFLFPLSQAPSLAFHMVGLPSGSCSVCKAKLECRVSVNRGPYSAGCP